MSELEEKKTQEINDAMIATETARIIHAVGAMITGADMPIINKREAEKSQALLDTFISQAQSDLKKQIREGIEERIAEVDRARQTSPVSLPLSVKNGWNGELAGLHFCLHILDSLQDKDTNKEGE